MRSLLLSAALAATTLAAPAMAQETTTNADTSAASPSVNVNVDAPTAPAAPAPVESHSSTSVEKTTVVDHQPSSGGMDNTSLAVLVGIGVIGAAAVIGVVASNRA